MRRTIRTGRPKHLGPQDRNLKAPRPHVGGRKSPLRQSQGIRNPPWLLLFHSFSFWSCCICTPLSLIFLFHTNAPTWGLVSYFYACACMWLCASQTYAPFWESRLCHCVLFGLSSHLLGRGVSVWYFSLDPFLKPQAGHSPDFVYKEPCFPLIICSLISSLTCSAWST